MDLPFDAVVGSIPFAPEALRGSLRDFDSFQSRLLVHSANAIDEHVAAAARRFGPSRVGVFIGTSTGGLRDSEVADSARRTEGSLPQHYLWSKVQLPSAAIEVLRRRFQLTGPGFVVSTACSSGAKALGAGMRALASGAVDAAIVGGVDTLCRTTLSGFHALSVLSPTPCRPFARGRSGTNLGEGAALFVLERAGEGPFRILGVGESSDAHHMTAPHPEGLGARLAIRRALDAAALSPSDIEYVNAHGTGTPLNDQSESMAIEAELGRSVPVSSTKGLTGHTLGAAGAIEAALCLIAMEESLVPPSVGAEPVDDGIRIAVEARSRAAAIRIALSNSFAFGGSNACVVLGRAP